MPPYIHDASWMAKRALNHSEKLPRRCKRVGKESRRAIGQLPRPGTLPSLLCHLSRDLQCVQLCRAQALSTRVEKFKDLLHSCCRALCHESLLQVVRPFVVQTPHFLPQNLNRSASNGPNHRGQIPQRKTSPSDWVVGATRVVPLW